MEGKVEEEILRTQEKEFADFQKEYKSNAEKEWFRSLSTEEKVEFIFMLVLDPLIVVIFFYYLTQTVMSVILAYLVVDIALVIWQRKTQIKKLRYKEWLEHEGDRTEILLRKIQRLGRTEEEMKQSQNDE